MKKIEIFEPAMCCSSGLCGPGVDPELLRISTLVNSISKTGIEIKRYNLSSDPLEFVNNKVVNDQLNKDGSDSLPLTLLNGQVVKTKSYPTEEDLSQWLGMVSKKIDPVIEEEGCCSDKNSCDIRCSPNFKGNTRDNGCC